MQDCTQEPVVSEGLKGWITAKVMRPVEKAQEKVDEVQKSGDIDQLSQVQFELSKVKENCQGLKEKSEEHEEGMISLQRQHESDCACIIVQNVLLHAKKSIIMSNLLNRLEVLESDSPLVKEREERAKKRINPLPINKIIADINFKRIQNERPRADSGISVNSADYVFP